MELSDFPWYVWPIFGLAGLSLFLLVGFMFARLLGWDRVSLLLAALFLLGCSPPTPDEIAKQRYDEAYAIAHAHLRNPGMCVQKIAGNRRAVAQRDGTWDAWGHLDWVDRQGLTRPGIWQVQWNHETGRITKLELSGQQK